ncbi:MAG: hypothetical protein NZ528_15175 [Caldilineales bacterium]|nr:hypothetical protein [Caldilineales bacterium]
MSKREPEPTSQVIAYLWVPCFAAAVARRADPRLGRGPLVLLDAEDRVLAGDLLAAQAGVGPGLTRHQAVARCPQATLVPASRYPLWEAQERFLEQLKAYSDRWQPDGLGCAYVQAPFTFAEPASTAVGGALPAWCQGLADVVRDLGWRPTLGATASKFGAGVAGWAAGENAGLLLAPAAQRAFLAHQPASLLPLDEDALRQLRHLGIRTLGQFARLPAAGVLARFGQAGRTAQRWAQGLDPRPVVPPWEAPEVSVRLECEPPLADGERLLAALAHRVEPALAVLRSRLQAATQVRLQITRTDGRVLLLSHTFPQPTAATEPVRLALARLLARADWSRPAAELVEAAGAPLPEPVEGSGVAEAAEAAVEVVVTLAGIADASVQQAPLFPDLAADSRQRLTATLDRLAARFGADAFRLATLADPDHPLLERRSAFLPWR